MKALSHKLHSRLWRSLLVFLMLVMVLAWRVPKLRDAEPPAPAATATPEPPATSPALPPVSPKMPRGYLTSVQELASIRQEAAEGVEPFAATVEHLLEFADDPEAWSYGEIKGALLVDSGDCVAEEGSAEFIEAQYGGHEVYRKVLAYHLTLNRDYAQSAREKILDLTDTTGFGGAEYSGANECILMLAFAMPVWIQAADLLETVWSEDDKHQFQDWLAREVYPKVAWASRVRANNWGSAASLTASMIADYLWNRDVLLVEVMPERLSLTPAQAYAAHNALQLARMNGVLAGDSQCPAQGIQAYGGIPDELRRGSTGCTGERIEDRDSALRYTNLHIEHLVFHAEFLLRRGDPSIYENVAVGNRGSLLQAIRFVLDNPAGSTSWSHSLRGTLFVAYHYYGDPILLEEAEQLETFKGGMTLTYARLTHPPDVEMPRPVTTPP